MTSTPDDDVVAAVEAVLRDRLTNAPAGSYSVTLLRDSEQARRKLMEEAFEVCLELGRPEVVPDRVAEEAADLVFHLLAALVGAGLGWQAVVDELRQRRAAMPGSGA